MSYPGMSEREVFNGALDVVDEYVSKGEIPVIVAWSIIRQAALRNHAELAATDSQHTQPKICPHYYEATDGVHVVVVGRCNCAGKLQAGA